MNWERREGKHFWVIVPLYTCLFYLCSFVCRVQLKKFGRFLNLGEWRVSKLENICLYLPLLFPSSKPPRCDLPLNWTKSSEYFSRELPLLGGEDLRAQCSDLNDQVCEKGLIWLTRVKRRCVSRGDFIEFLLIFAASIKRSVALAPFAGVG